MKDYLQTGIEYDFIFKSDSEQRSTFIKYEKVGDIKFLKVRYFGIDNLINPSDLAIIAASKATDLVQEFKEYE